MHIPKGASQTCALLTFDDALHCTEHDDYDAARWLYVPPYYTEYRYILGTRGENPLICIGINPSTAQPGDLDNTLKSVERIALGKEREQLLAAHMRIDMLACPRKSYTPRHIDLTARPKLPSKLAALRRPAARPRPLSHKVNARERRVRSATSRKSACGARALPCPTDSSAKRSPAMPRKSACGATPSNARESMRSAMPCKSTMI